MEPRKEKLLRLDSILKELNSMVVAFSGGVDSTFLFHRANIIRKSGVIAVTIKTPYIPAREIEEAENMLLELGYPGTRVRLHGDLARIECVPGYIDKIVRSPDKEHIISNLKRIGFRYVSLDLEGYRTVSSNPEKRVI